MYFTGWLISLAETIYNLIDHSLKSAFAAQLSAFYASAEAYDFKHIFQFR